MSVASKHRRRSSRTRESGERQRKTVLPKLSAGQWTHLGLMWSGRIVLLLMISAAPWYYGSATWGVQFWLMQGSWLVLLLTVLSVAVQPASAKHISAIAFGMAALLLIGLAQIVPLPSLLQRQIASTPAFEREVQQVTSAWESAASSTGAEQLKDADGPSGYGPVSIDPTQTAASIAAMTTAIVCLVAATQFFSTRMSIVVLLVAIVIGASAHSFFGLIQYLSWNHWTYLKMPHSSHFSTFVSRNSAPPYYATAIGSAFALFGVSLREQRRKNFGHCEVRYPAINILSRIRRRLDDVLGELNGISVTAIVALIALLLGVIAAASRGGALSNLFALLLTGFLVLGTRNGTVKFITAVTLLGAVVVLIMNSLELDEQLMSRFESLEESVFQGEEGRLQVWRLSLGSLAWYWMLGSGIGTYHFAILPFHNIPPNIWYYHAESLPIELLCETGIIGFAVLCFVVTKFFLDLRVEHARKKHRNVLLVAVVFASCAIGLHSLVDFSLLLPGVYVPFVALLGAFLGERQRHASERLRSSSKEAEPSESPLPSKTSRVKSTTEIGTDGVKRASARKVTSHGRMLGLEYSCVAAIVVLVCLIGFDDLAGYAASESLAATLKEVKAASASRVSDSTDSAKAKKQDLVIRQEDMALYADGILKLYPKHPEANLQAARVKQYLWQEAAIQNWNWENVPLAERKTWSNPRLVATAFRGPNEQGYAELKRLAESDQDGLKTARQVFNCYRLASAQSPLDWRAALGSFHSDFGWQGSREQSEIAASVFVLAGKRKDFALDVGQLLLREQKKSAALEILTALFHAQPTLMTQKSLSLIVNYLSPQELPSIFRDDVEIQAELFELLDANPKWESFRSEVLSSLRPKYHTASAASLQGWCALATVARAEGDKASEEGFLKKATDLYFNRHDIRYRYAKLLIELGKLDDARQEIEKCLRQTTGNAQYTALLENVKSRLDQKLK